MAKHYIWKCRSKERQPTQNNFLFFLKYMHQLENKTPRNLRKCKPLLPSLDRVSPAPESLILNRSFENIPTNIGIRKLLPKGII